MTRLFTSATLAKSEKICNQSMNRDIAHDFVSRVSCIPEVTECYNISGNYDYLLKVHARDMKQYQEFVVNKLGTIESLGSVESSFVMSEVKPNCGIAL